MLNRSELGRPLWAAVVVAIFSLAGPARVAAGGEQAVPFEAVLSGTAEWEYPSTVANCQGAGIATQLGFVTSECTAVLAIESYGYDSRCAGEGTENALPNVNTAVLIAANGDRLVLVSIDIACEIEPLTSFHATGAWTVHPSMSTGRFAGVTGTGTCDANVDFAAGIFEITWSGEIAY